MRWHKPKRKRRKRDRKPANLGLPPAGDIDRCSVCTRPIVHPYSGIKLGGTFIWHHKCRCGAPFYREYDKDGKVIRKVEPSLAEQKEAEASETPEEPGEAEQSE